MIYPRSPQHPEHVGRHYDDLDEFYREIWGDHLHHGLWLTGRESTCEAVQALILHAAGRAGLRDGVAVCDVGCGYGAVARLLADELAASVTGLTVSRRQHEYAVRTYGGPSCDFVRMDWMHNELPQGVFDVVIAIESLSHMPDKARFFSEAFRVLKPGGTIIVVAWLAEANAGRFQRRHLLEAICAEGRLPSMPDRSEVLQLAGDAGFEVTDIQLLTKAVRRTWTICLLRLLHKIATDRRYQRYLTDSSSSDRRFLLTIVRIVIAYRTGAMQYGLFVGTRPGAPR